MDFALKGKTALVTGASQGIGLAIARALLAEGVSVMITSRTPERLQQATALLRDQPAANSGTDQPQLHAVIADLGLRSEVDRLARQAEQELGRVDILVNSASAADSKPFFEMSDEALVEVWQVKALGYMRLIRAIAPGMMQRRSGNIVNVVGGTARTPSLDFIAGSMVNAALVNFTRGISRELAPYGVRINSISPGWTMTERQERSFAMEAAARKVSVQEIERLRSRSVPLHRLVSSDEIAILTLLVVSDRLPSMTGEDIVLDGGATPST